MLETNFREPMKKNFRIAFVALAVSALLVFGAIRIYHELAISKAREEIAKHGGAIQISGYESRYVFRNANLIASELAHLAPYLKRIPPTRDVNSQLPPCRVLDLTAANAITFDEVNSLLSDMDSTMVLFSHNGHPAKVMSPDLKRHLDDDARTKR